MRPNICPERYFYDDPFKKSGHCTEGQPAEALVCGGDVLCRLGWEPLVCDIMLAFTVR
jgi:hypothetical protein